MHTGKGRGESRLSDQPETEVHSNSFVFSKLVFIGRHTYCKYFVLSTSYVYPLDLVYLGILLNNTCSPSLDCTLCHDIEDI